MKTTCRGYSLVVVLLVLGLITVGLFSALSFLEMGVRNSAETVERRQMFYVCDGLTRIVAEALQVFMRTATLEPGEDGATALRTYLEREDVGGGPDLHRLVPAGFVLAGYEVNDYEHVGDAVPIPTGAFAGLIGREDKLRLGINARRADGRFSCRVVQDLSLSQVGLFQMTLLSAIPATRLHIHTANPSVFGIVGRTHANGDLLIGNLAGSSSMAFVDTLTAAGRIHGGSACSGAAATVQVADTDLLTTTTNPPLTVAETSADGRLHDPLRASCVDADWFGASGASLVGDRAADVRLGVAPLSLPLPVPAGELADPLRYLVEPMVNDPVNDDRERHKLAYQADVRIIDGVWYLANPLNRGDWPGLPIWSDHPGHATATFVVGGSTRSLDVGQEDLRSARGWTTTPRLFSAYAFDVRARRFLHPGFVTAGNDETPAVTYGTLGADGRPTLSGIQTPPIACERPEETTPVPHPFAAQGSAAPANFAAACRAVVPGSTWTTTGATLEAARVGFQDMSLTRRAPPAAQNVLDGVAVAASRGNILPINMSVKGFQTALSVTDASAKELGSYFSPGSRTFNGIVWIASRWPGAWTTRGVVWPDVADASGTAPPAPLRHSFVGSNLTKWVFTSTDEPAQQPLASRPALPFPLCSEDLAGTPYDDDAFAVHDCAGAWYDTSDGRGAWPNALRIVGANSLHQTAAGVASLPFGLTIATPLPVYLHADGPSINGGSLPALHAGDVGQPGSENWRPFAIAADNVAVLSAGFHDDEHWWWNTSAVGATPVDLVINAEILTGVGTGACGGGGDVCGDSVVSGLRFVEPWQPGSAFALRGSLVVGHHARGVDVATPDGHQDFFVSGSVPVVQPPARVMLLFDHTLNRLERQPPGTEALGITSVRQWERD